MSITPPIMGRFFEKRRFATHTAENKMTLGIMAIGLIITWIFFIPFNGPILLLVNITNNFFYPQLYMIALIFGLLGSSYCLTLQKGIFLIKTINTISPALLAVLTLFLIVETLTNNKTTVSIVLLCFGLLSGWIIGRWIAWFLSDLTSGKRGSVFGKSLTFCLILISMSKMVLANFSDHVIVALIVLALTVMAGGYLIRSLPIKAKQRQPLTKSNLSNIFPPTSLILFAVLGYSVVAITYKLLTLWSLKEPVSPWMLIIPYSIIGLILGPYSDQAGRSIFFILGFLFTGIGFILIITSTDQYLFLIIISLLINAGLLFIHLYYWLSLADHQDPRFSPLTMAIGVSIKLTIFTISYTIVNFATDKPNPSLVNIGLTGVAIILFGFAILNALSMLNNSSLNSYNTNYTLTNGFKTDTNNDNPASEAYYIMIMGKEKYLNAVKKQFQLTKKEAEIAFMLSLGYSYQDIKRELYITNNTLKYHLKNIYSKLSVS